MVKFPELETRRKIYHLIFKNPGLHLSKIAELLNIRISLTEYHLMYLEKNGIVVGIKEAGYRRYYTKDKMGVGDKKVLSLLRQEIPLKIVFFLLEHPCSRHRDIIKHLDISPSTLSYHLNKLMKAGVIVVNTEGTEKGFVIADEKEIIGLLTRYKPYAVIESFKDIWIDFKVD